MSNVDKPNEPAAPKGARPDPLLVDPLPTRPMRDVRAPAPRPRGGGSLALAVLLSLLAVGACGYIGWRQWQQEQGVSTAVRDAIDLHARVASLEATLGTISGERSSLDQRLADAAAVNRSLREELLGQAERTRNLEDAVAKLAEKSLSGHDAMLLDETESLLRMASERYTLFHDAQGAAAAYALADRTLAAVNDSAFGGLRQSIGAEREALAKNQPASQASALQQLAELRGSLDRLPLKSLDTANSSQPTDAWSRIGRALARVVTVQRDNGAPLAVADARFARELAALDLAQAQAALLAYDSKAYAAALQRVDASLASQFDGNAPAVQQARDTLRQLAAQLPAGAPVQLGAALTELRNLRSVHALSPAGDGTAPAAAATVAPPGGARR
ncbi:uroporphyrinogen-III C-methyltransferase [Rhodanobacter umsongensis]|uniref:Uroporphyrinogen-III C-methyltransferase n=1 Tax=Rhodanobacter umsongensis TaxID=633153 RepID=A0ABW0JJX6_9GAMM